MGTSKSPIRVLRFGLLIGELGLRKYSHRFSPKKFTQPQLFACLVLKEFLRLDYRKLAELLTDCSDLRLAIDLTAVPHFTTFQKASRRLLRFHQFDLLLHKTIRYAQVCQRLPKRIDLAALDGTGFESRHASQYYVKRRAKGGKSWQKTTYARYPKAGILCDTRSHLILAMVPGRGPGSDSKHFRPALNQALGHVPLKTLAADAAYDGEASHTYARRGCGVRSLIPPRIGRPTRKPPSGYWRRQMSRRLHLTRYGQRWQVETVNSMVKRLLDSALRARNYWSQFREMLLRALTLNIMILWRPRVFYRAGFTQ